MTTVDWNKEEWVVVVLKQFQDDKKISKVVSVQSSAATQPGDNYTSIMERTKITGYRGSGQPVSISLIVKKKLSTEQSATLLTKAFKKEKIVYKRVLDTYSEIIKGSPLVGQEMWAKCYYASDNAIVLEDLKILGYSMVDKKIGLDLSHGLLAISSLGRLHGCSVVAMERGLVDPNILEGFTLLEETVIEFYRGCFYSLANCIAKNWSPEWLATSEKIKEFALVIHERLQEKYVEETPLKVICHGDCWINNQLYKYDLQGNPIHVKFVDFQLSYVGSYAWDLNFFIHSSITEEDRTENYKLLLRTYRDSMQETFEILRHDRKAPNLDEVEKECHRLRISTFITDSILAPFNDCESKDAIDIDDLVAKTDKTENIYSKPKFTKYFKSALPRYMEDGIL